MAEKTDTGEKREWFVELSVNRARRMAEDGDIEKAYEILVGVTAHKHVSTFNDLLSGWKKELLLSLQSRFPNLLVYPQRVNTGQDIKDYKLRAREAYVLELFDGTTTLDDAIAISPVDEFETLRATSRLIELGLLRLGQPA